MEDWLYSAGNESADSLEQIVLYYLGLRGATLAVAESCTGGMIAQRITGVPGSSRSFVGGAIAYSNEMKTAFAGVPPELIAAQGAVSADVAEALAYGIRRFTGATLGVGVTGIAGPSGGTDAKPVGLVYIALSDAQKTESIERAFAATATAFGNGPLNKLSTSFAVDSARDRLFLNLQGGARSETHSKHNGDRLGGPAVFHGIGSDICKPELPKDGALDLRVSRYRKPMPFRCCRLNRL